MMITTPTAISLIFAVFSMLITTGLQAFAVYDARTKRVPNKGLAFFLPVILAALPFRYMVEQPPLALYICSCIAGAAVGGGILLAAAMATKGGIGGGDIKLAAAVGFFYGPYDMLTILLAGTLLAFLYGLIKCRKTGNKELHIAFVPFLAFGSLIITFLYLKGVLFP